MVTNVPQCVHVVRATVKMREDGLNVLLLRVLFIQFSSTI